MNPPAPHKPKKYKPIYLPSIHLNTLKRSQFLGELGYALDTVRPHPMFHVEHPPCKSGPYQPKNYLKKFKNCGVMVGMNYVY